jgi:hypothetical protein
VAVGLLQRREHRGVVDPVPGTGQGVLDALARLHRGRRLVMATRLAVLEHEMLQTDRTVAGENHGALDDVAQFADVAGVVVGEQHLDYLGRERDVPVAVFDTAEEVLGDRRDVALVLP